MEDNSKMNVTEKETRRIVLLGKTGVGKSSLANTIFAVEKKSLYSVRSSPNSETSKCDSHNKFIQGKNTHLIDTPGIFDTNPRSTELSPEILKCIKECVGGVHAFLIVFKVDRFTQQEQEVVDIILKYFSEEALKYATLVFTRGSDLEGKSIREWIEPSVALKALLKKCGDRCHVFDNKDWDNKTNVTELLKTIDQTVEKNGNKCYTNDMLSNGKTFWEKLKKKAAHIGVGILLGALLGAVAFIPLLQCGIPLVVATTVIATTAGGVAGGTAAAQLSDLNSQTITEASNFFKDLETLFAKQSQVNGKSESFRCRIL